MNVCLINNLPRTSGVGRYAISLYDALKDMIKIDMFLFSREDYSLYKYSQDQVYIIKKINRNVLFDNFIFRKYKISNLLLDYRLGRYIFGEYDIYHITNQNMSCLTYYPNIRGRNVITVHDIAYYRYPESKIQKYLSKILYSGINSCDAVISISNSTKDDLIKYFNIDENRIHVVYHGIDTNVFKPLNVFELDEIYTKYKIDKGRKILLHIGAGMRKNTKSIFLILYKLVNKFNLKNMQLIKVKYTKNDLLLANELNLQKYIKFIDFVPEEDLPKLYNIADVFIFPSIYEGFGFPVLEAMACGTPVVASNTSSLPELVGDAGITVNPNDIDSLAQAVYTLIKDDSLRHELTKKGLKRVKKFTWEKCAKKTMEVYKACLKS